MTQFLPLSSTGGELSGDIHEGPMPSEAAVEALQGAQGRYPNRSDLRSARPVRFPSDRAAPQAWARGNVRAPIPPGYHMAPSAAPGALPVPPSGAPPGAVLGGTLQSRFAAAIDAARGAPGSGPGLAQPTGRPFEPVTAGAPIGPGPGPEILGLPAPPGMQQNPRAVLSALAARFSDPDLSALVGQAGSPTQSTLGAPSPGPSPMPPPVAQPGLPPVTPNLDQLAR